MVLGMHADLEVNKLSLML